MACYGFFTFLLKFLNFILTLVGLAIVSYGVYLLVEWLKLPSSNMFLDEFEASSMLLGVLPLRGVVDELAKAWFLYAFIGVGVIFLLMSFFGCIGASTRIGCCLPFYMFLIILLIIAELAFAVFAYIYPDWKKELPVDNTGDLDMIFNFLQENWNIGKWVALGAAVFEALLFAVALAVHMSNQTDFEDDDDELGVRQPFVNPAPGVPTLGYRPSQNDPWTVRMREKYGNAYPFSQQYPPPAPVQQRRSGGCIIL